MLTDYTMTLNRAGIPVWRPAQPVIGKEEAHQTALTNWARMMRTQYPALRLYHHIPNGGLRDKRTAARLIWQGVHSGVPDVFIPAARGGKPEGIAVEMADCLIRILDWFGHEGLDVDGIVREKMLYNKGRPYKHGKKC